ncbi:MAG: hypothetical protein A2675_02915 [Candidatus Yonathbacteria bacterium RIFCSPHIGHO2_01_FULL_51_10]|uniref:Uncharacterized protein n=1 Tax=Candidatus Yonathbacteria bacterium RIFCSPHIGHO2_01_FULL_51_10 TaxID=1802723 RepID=A0A1G2S9I7_9BACT|nr:MAG: hypothetical protein A2675_02915 [Candidatus Yonathbacteria bacterium RIFCSPHIGHO2_01_FULL_51_10]
MDKKNIIIAILIILLAISGYFFFQRNSEKNLAFENNLKCAQYIDQQNKEINEIANLPINEGKIVTAPKIFFSTKLNTCVSAFTITDFRNKGFSSYYINNLLNNDSIFSEGGQTDETIDGVSLAEIAEQKYRAKLKELGGE